MALTLKRLAPWCLVTGIILFAIWGVLPFYFAGKRDRGIELLAGYAQQLCRHRIAHGSYPEQFVFPTVSPGFSRVSYRRATPQSFRIDAEIQLSTGNQVTLQASPQGVFVWSAQASRWELAQAPPARCRPPR